jgi:hypothetical protein
MNLGVFFSVLTFLTPIVLAQTHEPSSTTQRQALRAEIESDLSKLPSKKVDRISEVWTAHVENGRIALEAQLQTDEREMRIEAPGIDGFIRLRQPPPPNPIHAFMFLVEDLTEPQTRHVITTISNAGRILISRDMESDEVESSVQFLQDPAGEELGPVDQPPVRLFVNVDYADEARKPVKIQAGANDFVQLRRQNQPVVDEYLRPIFRDYDQEAAVFGIPSNVAWQVLGAASTAGGDEQTMTRLKEILTRLDADDFRQRQQAAAELKAMGKAASLALEKMDRSKLTLQQNSAVDAFLADAAPLETQDSSGLANDKSFLLDVLFADDAELRKLALKRLSEISGKPVSLDPNLSPAARADAIVKLRAQLIPATQPG